MANNPPVKPKLNMEQLAAQYGFAADLISTQDDLVQLFNDAVAGDWTDQSGNPSPQFYTALYSTPWYKNHADTWKQAYTREHGIDSTWEQRLIPTGRDAVLAAAGKLGVEITDEQAAGIAKLGMYAGWMSMTDPSNFKQSDLQTILTNGTKGDNKFHGLDTSAIAGFTGLKGQKTYDLGEVASVYAGLEQFAQDNGIHISDANLRKWSTQLLDPNWQGNPDDIYNIMTDRAKGNYPALANQLGSWTTADGKTRHTTVRDAADSYIQVMANSLGLDPAKIDVNDPLLSKVLQYKDSTGKETAMPLYQVKQEARMDKRWLDSDQADAEGADLYRSFANAFGIA
jgi:hypothetical protein